VAVPDVLVSVGDGPGIVATRGSSVLATCTTTAATDSVEPEPTAGLAAQPGDKLTLSLQSGWQVLHWSGSDHPAAGEGANVWPDRNTPERPTQIRVPVPIRPGESIASYHLDVIRADDRVVGSLEVAVRVTLPG
jgi:hypothetical protein